MKHALLVIIIMIVMSSTSAMSHNATAFHRYKPSQSLRKGVNFRSITTRFGGTLPDAKVGPILPVCKGDGGTAALQTGWWQVNQAAGQVFFEPSGCRLRRRTHAQAMQCLTGKRISFAGDSVSRFHFTSLAAWLTTGYLPQPYEDATFCPTNAYKYPS